MGKAFAAKISETCNYCIVLEHDVIIYLLINLLDIKTKTSLLIQILHKNVKHEKFMEFVKVIQSAV